LELDGAHAEFDRAGDDDPLRLTIDHPVDRSALTPEAHSGFSEGNGERQHLPAVRVANNSNVRSDDLTAALTFFTDVPVVASRIGQAELVPDTDEDRAALDAFGTAQVYVKTTFRQGIRTFPPIVIDGDAIRALLPHAAGLRLYADALAAATDVARYRDLWRVLESAFGQKESKLVAALSS
jgi:hypothetical protein